VQLYACTEERDRLASDFFALLQELLSLPADVISLESCGLQGPDAAAEFLRTGIGIHAQKSVGHPVEEFRKWFDGARNGKHTGPYLNWLYQRSLWLSEKVRIESNLYRSATTPEMVVTELAQKIFGSLKSHNALIVSSGFNGERFVKRLVDNNIGDLYFANSEASEPNLLGSQYRGSQVEFEAVPAVLPRVNLLLLLDEQAEETLAGIDLKKSLDKRKHGPLFALSYASSTPGRKSIKRLLAGVYNAFIYDRQDLERIITKNLQEREKISDVVEQLITSEVEDFTQWLQANEQYRFGNIIGKSAAMQNIMELIARIAQSAGCIHGSDR
jgi:glutamyl-tRNA reductase